MAGRYVILEFDNKLNAEAFISQRAALDADGADVRGVFLSPDKFCKCPDKARQNNSNWARGSRSGIWLCRRCKKPSRHHQGGLLSRLRTALGNNLLEVD